MVGKAIHSRAVLLDLQGDLSKFLSGDIRVRAGGREKEKSDRLREQGTVSHTQERAMEEQRSLCHGQSHPFTVENLPLLPLDESSIQCRLGLSHRFS